MAYLILRDDSPNVSASFATEAEALAEIRRAVMAQGERAVRGCALAHSPEDGGLIIVAEDGDLARLAMAPLNDRAAPAA